MFNVEKPRRESAIHDAFVTARIEGVLVLDIFDFVNNSLVFEAFGDEFVGGPDLNAVIVSVADAESVEFVGVFCGIVAILVQSIDKINFVLMFKIESVIVFAISGSAMDDASAFIFADKVSGEDLTNRAVYATIRLAGKVPARDFVFDDFVWFYLGRGENENFVPYFNLGVVDVGTDCEHAVSHQGPGGGSPSEKIGRGLGVIVHCEFKLNEDARVGDGLVSVVVHSDLGFGNRGGELGIVH